MPLISLTWVYDITFTFFNYANFYAILMIAPVDEEAVAEGHYFDQHL